MNPSSRVIIRKKMQDMRLHVPQEQQKKAALCIGQHIHASPLYQQAQHIAFYYPMRGEVNLDWLWKSAQQEEKYIYFPIMQADQTLQFFLTHDKTVFQKNKCSVLEPIIGEESPIPIDVLELILVPLLAFDQDKNRLGMGAGYYDKTLVNASNPQCLGIGYDFQRVDHIDAMPWDIPLHWVVTEAGII